MKTYPTVEDYLEVLAGQRDIQTLKPITSWFLSFEPIISLARYDVNVLTNMAETTASNKALTHKQANLLCSVLLKYKRQLAAKGIDVSPVESPVWRTPLRTMDYSQRLFLRDDKIIVKFPFSTSLIEELKDFRKTSQGAVVYDRDAKEWVSALTEYNLNWLHTWATSVKFEIDPEITKINDLILDAEQTPFKIELRYGPEKMEITNCPDSMHAYIEEHLGGFGHDNLLQLIDSSSVLGYTIEDDLMDVVEKQWGIVFKTLATNVEVIVDPNTALETTFGNGNLKAVMDYAIETNRLPVVVYEPDMSSRLMTKLCEWYPEDNAVFTIGTRREYELPEGVKIIHTEKPIHNMERIPLLVTSAGMIYGIDKQIMAQRSEKVVYVASEVYSPQVAVAKNTKKVIKL